MWQQSADAARQHQPPHYNNARRHSSSTNNNTCNNSSRSSSTNNSSSSNSNSSKNSDQRTKLQSTNTTSTSICTEIRSLTKLRCRTDRSICVGQSQIDQNPGIYHPASSTTSTLSSTIGTVVPVIRLLGLTLMLLLCCTQGLAVEPAGRDVLDLVQGLQATSADQLSGLRYTRGLSNDSRALLLEDPSRRLALPHSVTERALAIISGHREVTFICSLRQDVGTSGTLLALATDTKRFLEIESSGRRNELRFHFMHDRQPKTETFPYLLADGQWHKLAFYLSGDSLALYVDCERIYRRVIATPDRFWTAGGSTSQGGGDGHQEYDGDVDKLQLYLGQRNSHHALFRGALQDVKLVSQAHGYLLQCPSSDTDCPTCAQFQALEEQLHHMSNMYKELNNKLSRAEGRISDLEQCECLRACVDENGIQRKEGEEWKKDQCNFCRCKNGVITCHHEECQALDCKNPVRLEGECCPVCLSRCYYQGKHYDHGEQITPRVCVTCNCDKGRMVCESKNITADCPKLNCPKSDQLSIHGQCCPVCKDTDYCSLGHTCHANASCFNLATRFACQCHAGFDGDGHTCTDIDECKEVGGSHGHHCSANTRCVNVPGSYRCDCLQGHSRVDSYQCQDNNNCNHGSQKCHADASCVKVNGTFKCLCKDGYSGDGYTCSPHCPFGCRNGGKCIRPNVCECRHGYIGPACDLDIDECAMGISRCSGNSVCVNRPGWYRCQCLEGYHSAWADNHFGSLCLDVDECLGEGEGHTCHPSMQCVNTVGSYECQCKPGQPCTSSCVAEGDEHPDGQTWTSTQDKCNLCTCNGGKVTCEQKSCDCNDPSVDLDCCPTCDLTGTCQHQAYTTVQQSGDTWQYQCQLCECRRGEVDCWPLECPVLDCPNEIQLAGDCCPVCADSNKCGSLTLGTGGQDLSHAECHYKSDVHRHGETWTLHDDHCTECQCKAGHICCSYNQDCSNNLFGG